MVQVHDMTSVEWRSIAEFPGYWISSAGQVRHYARELKPTPRSGYLRVCMRSEDGRRHFRPIHLLVLETFVGPRPSSKHHGAHFPDNDKSNNRLENLAWKLPTENEADKRACGTAPKGGRNWRPNRARVERVRARAAAGESFTKIARDEGLHRYSVSRIVRGLRRRAA
jgi:hypothetical protein